MSSTSWAYYLIIFFREVIGILFIISAAGKIGDLKNFIQTVMSFKILPRQIAHVAAVIFLSCEILVVISMIEGKRILSFGFVLAALLLLTFSIALASVIKRGIQTSCNCFGKSKKLVSIYDIQRNVGIILCAIGGVVVAQIMHEIDFKLLDLLVVIPFSTIFVLALLNFHELAQIFQKG